MYDKVTTEIDVEIDTSKKEVVMGKPISAIYEVSFRNNEVHIAGRFEGDANSPWKEVYTRETLPSAEAKTLYDSVVAAVNSLHLSLRQADGNYKTNQWVKFVEPAEETPAP